MSDSVQERRKYLRVETPLQIRVITKDKGIIETTTKNISPLGLRFEFTGEGLEAKDEIELRMEIPNTLNPVHAKARVVWKKKLSTEDKAPFDLGCEFTKIEEDNKNTFLKYFCDLLYKQAEQVEKQEEA